MTASRFPPIWDAAPGITGNAKPAPIRPAARWYSLVPPTLRRRRRIIEAGASRSRRDRNQRRTLALSGGGFVQHRSGHGTHLFCSLRTKTLKRMHLHISPSADFVFRADHRLAELSRRPAPGCSRTNQNYYSTPFLHFVSEVVRRVLGCAGSRTGALAAILSCQRTRAGSFGADQGQVYGCIVEAGSASVFCPCCRLNQPLARHLEVFLAMVQHCMTCRCLLNL